MTAITFDTLNFMEQLRKSGIPKAIARAFANAQTDSNLATQSDLKSLEYRLVIKLCAMLTLATGLIVTLGKIL